MPHETGFNAADNPYTESEFFKICEDYGVPNDPMKYRDENFIGLISVVFIGLMTTLARLNDPVDNREIGGFHRRWFVKDFGKCQGLCLFNFKFPGLC